MADYTTNNIKIFIARRLIESNGPSGVLLPRVPSRALSRGRLAGASGFCRECVGSTYALSAHLIPAQHGPVTIECRGDREDRLECRSSSLALSFSRLGAHNFPSRQSRALISLDNRNRSTSIGIINVIPKGFPGTDGAATMIIVMLVSRVLRINEAAVSVRIVDYFDKFLSLFLFALSAAGFDERP